jgi:transposase
MEMIGLDLHTRESQLCVLGEDGAVVAERRIATTRERFAAVLGGRAPARVLLEAYLGLVPSGKSSGERRRRGRIAKAGNARVRWLPVEAAWRVQRSRAPETAALRAPPRCAEATAPQRRARTEG